MGSNYPGGLDAFATAITSVTPLSGPPQHSQVHNDLADAVNKIETELGTDPSGVAATVAARLNNLGVFNAKDYGALGDNAADDTAAIQAAIIAAEASTSDNPVVYLPRGRYRGSGALNFTRANLLGDGPFSTYIVWDGAEGGTAYSRPAGTNRYIKGVRFINGTAKPGIYVDMGSSGGIDWGGGLQEVYLGPISESAGVAAIRTGSIINFHMRGMRFSGGAGYIIEIRHASGAPQRSFTLDNFTIDSSGFDTLKGIVHLVPLASNSNLTMAIRNGRIESGNEYASPGGLVVVESDPANSLGTEPADILLENLAIQVGGVNGMRALVHQETTQTSVASNLIAINVRKSGLQAIATGSWSSAAGTIPQVCDGPIRLLTFGRTASGGTKHNRTHLSHLAIGGLGNSVVSQHISATATLDFPSVAAQSAQELTISAPGAAVGDVCYASPSTTLEAGLVWSAWVSATDTVRIRVANVTIGAIDPASRSWRADVWKHV